MIGDEVRDRRRHLAAIGAYFREPCLRELDRDFVAHVARPALGGVESGLGHVGFGPGQAAELAGEVIKHESSLANPTDSQPLRATVGSN